MKLKGYQFVAYFLLALCCAFILTQVYIGFDNTLARRKIWYSLKAEGERSVAHSRYFFEQAVSLAGGKLNLGVWHGNQQISLRESVPARDVSVEFELTPESVFYIFWKKQNHERDGLRIGQSDLHPPVTFTIDRYDQFIHKQKIELPPLLKGRNRLKITFEPDLTVISLNEKKIAQQPRANSKALFEIGLRGGVKPVLIHNILIRGEKGETILSEGFYWSSRYSGLLLCVTIFIFAIFLLLSGFVRKDFMAWSALAAIVIVTVGSVIWAANFFILSYRYPSYVISVSPPVYNEQRKSLYQSQLPPDQKAKTLLINEKYIKKISGKAKYRIATLGSSQTWGEGAPSAEDSWPSQLQLMLNQDNERPSGAVVNNLAQAGLVTTQMLQIYREYLQQYVPDLLILSVGTNDMNYELFRSSVEQIILLSRRQNVEVLILFEPNDPQIRSQSLVQNHDILRAVCAEQNVVCFDMQGYMQREAVLDRGIYWQDHVHLTAFGYRNMAGKIRELVALFF